jgi:hypothetical protein
MVYINILTPIHQALTGAVASNPESPSGKGGTTLSGAHNVHVMLIIRRLPRRRHEIVTPFSGYATVRTGALNLATRDTFVWRRGECAVSPFPRPA